MSRIVNDRPQLDRNPRVRDKAYLHWLHAVPCIACEIEQYPAWPETHPIEAAHQKFTEGLGGKLGKRPSDEHSCSLCAYCHRLAPNACDRAQTKFWRRLGVSPKDYCAELYAAFKGNSSGAAVVEKFVRIAREIP